MARLTARHGRSAFAILLFQDLAIMPALALLPLLAGAGGAALDWRAIALPVVAAAGVVVAGRYALRPALRIIAATRAQDAFTAAALLVVVGTALLFESVGLSMALGAFIAGVLLADSEYRHELEADIEPFKGLLLGLFFIAVGMSANLGVLLESPLTVIALTAAYMAVKTVAVFIAARIARHDSPTAWRLASRARRRRRVRIRAVCPRRERRAAGPVDSGPAGDRRHAVHAGRAAADRGSRQAGSAVSSRPPQHRHTTRSSPRSRAC